MHKKLKVIVATALSLIFIVSALASAVLANPPGSCLRCKKTDCPAGYCYVDCGSCCYLFHGQIYCFK